MIMCLSVRNTFYKAVSIKKPKFREEYHAEQALHITDSSVFQVSFSWSAENEYVLAISAFHKNKINFVGLFLSKAVETWTWLSF